MIINAKWIWVEEPWRSDVQAGWFRRRAWNAGGAFEAEIRLTADTRYRAWWNGEWLGRGPHCGVPAYWSYDTYRLLVKEGENVLAVEVLFQGQYELLKYGWLRPGLLSWCPEPGANELLATGSAWKAALSNAHAPRPQRSQNVVDGCYTALGAFEEIDFRKLPDGWQQIGFDDSGWAPAVELRIQAHYRDQTGIQENSWELVEAGIPPLAEEARPWRSLLRRGSVQSEAERAGPLWKGPEEAQRKAKPPFDPLRGAMEWQPEAAEYVILDAGEMTTAFVSLDVEGGEGTRLVLRYAEALSENLKKGRRDEAGQGTVEGVFDSYVLRGGPQVIEPFHWRAFRFLKIEVSGPCRVRRVTMRRTTYPGMPKASFACDDAVLNSIWETSWRTAQLCAHDIHEDCPYYEQLPYVGDLRLHGPLGLMVTGDHRLLERSIRFYSRGRRDDGMIVTRYPARIPQIIPPFALIWILLLEDYYQLTGKDGFAGEMWPTVEGILAWFAAREDAEDILIRPFPYWNFTDWSLPQNEGGEINAGNRASLTMFYAGALDAAARLAAVVGRPPAPLQERLARLRRAIHDKLWSDEEGLFRDDLGGAVTAAHQTILGILWAGLSEQEEQRAMRQVLCRDDLFGPTIPFSYYLFRAAEKTGMYHAVWSLISRWKAMLDLGATTWFETPEPTRSDCHAWGSWIARDFLTELLGIHPLEPGYRRVLVRPATCGLSRCEGAMPSPVGMIEVSWRVCGGELRTAIHLPSECGGGVFEAPDGSRHALSPGESKVFQTGGGRVA